MMVTSKKQLAVELSKLKGITGIKRGLEQYQTESEMAADIIWNAYMQGDIENNRIIDLGCGNGIFGIGALELGAAGAVFIDKDPEAINILRYNLPEAHKIIVGDVENVDFLDEKTFGNETGNKNIVIMNPPFGTKEEHADKRFLEKAFSFADVVYSVHKAESKGFLKVFSDENGYSMDKIFNYQFKIKKSHIAHKKQAYYVAVICAKFVRGSDDPHSRT